MKIRIFVMSLIILIAAVLRLYQLGKVPISPDWDEAALGYNAYSILSTGRDEYGKSLPLVFRSFDDYKPPLYVYLTVPAVAVFGLNTFSVRLPSALMGILAVIGTYFFVSEMFRKSALCLKLSLLSSFLLAISPWHIQFSRVAFEANVGLTFTIWAAACFIAGLRKHILLTVSAVLFGLGMYTYHSERLFLPLLLILLLVSYYKDVVKKISKKDLIISVCVGFIITLPLIVVLMDRSSLLRVRATSVFSAQTPVLERTLVKIREDASAHDTLGMLLDNRRFVWAKKIYMGYLSHFSLSWLFLSGDDARHHAPGMGLLYLWELPFFLLGIFIVLKKFDCRTKTVLICWLLTAPIPSAPTLGVPHAIRSLVMLPILQIFTAVGIIHGVLWINNRGKWFIRLFIYSFLCMLFIFNFVYFLTQYFIHTNPEYSQYWQYGYEQAVRYAEEHKNEYRKVIVSTNLEQPHMFFLFFTRYDPKKYVASGGTVSGGFAEKFNRFDKYEFRKIDWKNERRDGSILYIGTPDEIAHGTKANIMYLDGTPAIRITDRE